MGLAHYIGLALLVIAVQLLMGCNESVSRWYRTRLTFRTALFISVLFASSNVLMTCSAIITERNDLTEQAVNHDEIACAAVTTAWQNRPGDPSLWAAACSVYLSPNAPPQTGSERLRLGKMVRISAQSWDDSKEI